MELYVMDKHVIAIDGPAGSGKSTTARMVAAKLGFIYLDTGAMYRSITLLCLRDGIDVSDATALEQLARDSVIEFRVSDGSQLTFVNGEDVTEAIRTPEVTAAVSEVSAHPGVRGVLVERQREFGAKANLVVEGRDTTSVVFPNAFLKVYLTADVEARARRRLKDFTRIGAESTLDEQIAELRRRDAYDSGRDASPLTQTPDSVPLDTTNFSIDQQVDEVISLYRQKLAG